MPTPTSRNTSTREVDYTTHARPPEDDNSSTTSDRVSAASQVLKKEADSSDKPKLKKRVWKWIKNKYCVIKNQILKIFKSLRGKKKDDDEVNERSKSEIIIVNPVARHLSKENSQGKESVANADSSSDSAASSSSSENTVSKAIGETSKNIGETFFNRGIEYGKSMGGVNKEQRDAYDSGSSDASENIVQPQDVVTSSYMGSSPVVPPLLPTVDEEPAQSVESVKEVNPLLLLSDEEIYSLIIEDQIAKEKKKIDFEIVDQHRRKFPEKFNVEAEDKAYLASLLQDNAMSVRMIERLKINARHLDLHRRGLSTTRELPYDAFVKDDLYKGREALVERFMQQTPETKAQLIKAYKDQIIQSDKK